MPYYGGAITDEEWNNDTIKYCVHGWLDAVAYENSKYHKHFLAFHTEDQRDKFMSYSENLQLVKDYLMLS